MVEVLFEHSVGMSGRVLHIHGSDTEFFGSSRARARREAVMAASCQGSCVGRLKE
jgi:hypothetical protein